MTNEEARWRDNMTNKEAIKIINNMPNCKPWEVEALAMAIQALEQEPKTDGDCISRKDILKAIETWDKYGYTETGCFVREPKNDYVPYIHYDDVIKCIKGMPSVKPQEPKTYGDCVSRQAVIDILTRNGVHFCDMVKITSDLKELPSAIPKPKTGHWTEWDELVDKLAIEIGEYVIGNKVLGIESTIEDGEYVTKIECRFEVVKR